MEELKQRLSEIKEKEYSFDEIDKFQLLEELLEEIGNHDPELRDGLIYPVLAHLLHDSHFTKEELNTITNRLLSQEFLFFDLDNDIEYSSLIRSFTMLQLTILMYVHNRDGLYTLQEYNHFTDQVISYVKLEEDVRGYEHEVGFIHTLAHAADTFAQMVKAKEATDRLYRQLFDVINMKFDTGRIQFTNDEDERSVNALEIMIRTDKLDQEYLENWVELVGDYHRPKTYPEVYINNINIKSLLRSLYFRFIDEPEYKFLTDKIKTVLQEKVKLR